MSRDNGEISVADDDDDDDASDYEDRIQRQAAAGRAGRGLSETPTNQG